MSATPVRPEAVSRPSRTFVIALGLVALVTPLAVHLFFPVIPAVKAALGLTNAHAQFTFSVSLFDSTAELMAVPLIQHEGGRPPARVGLNHPSITPYGVFAAGDGGDADGAAWAHQSLHHQRPTPGVCGPRWLCPLGAGTTGGFEPACPRARAHRPNRARLPG